MAELVFKAPFMRFGNPASPTTTLWSYVRAVTLNYSADILDKTASGDDFRCRIAGLKQWSVTVEFNDDYADGMIDDYFFTKIGKSSTDCWIAFRPSTSAVANTNPEYKGLTYLESFPTGGTVGDLATKTLTFIGDSTLARAES